MTIIQQTKPFVYLIGWSKQNKFYYGVKYAKGCQPSDLWTKYFTSSETVKKFRKIFGEPDIIQVRKVFNCENHACNWERKVLRRLGVPKNEKFLNGHCGGAGYNATVQAAKVNKGVVTVFDNDGNSYRIASDDPRIKTGKLFGNRKNFTTVFDKFTGQKITIPCDEYNKELYTHLNLGRNFKCKNRKGKALYHNKDGEIILIENDKAKELGLKSERINTAPFKNIKTGERKIFDLTSDELKTGEWVGVNKGIPINKGIQKISKVCDIFTRKEYSLSNWNQFIRKMNKPMKEKKVYSCVCNIETRKHYDKASWNRYNPDLRINHPIKNNECFLFIHYTFN